MVEELKISLILTFSGEGRGPENVKIIECILLCRRSRLITEVLHLSS